MKYEYIINIEHLKKSFDSNEVLKDINLKLRSGESVAILGKSGTGKSVILQCLIGLLELDSGTIEIFGKNISTLDSDELNAVRTKIGFLFQSGALYDSMSVRENLAFPILRNNDKFSEEETEKKIEQRLRDVNLIDAIDKMPSELSGGMKKRIGLARTLMLEPEIMIYDEPTTGLDPITTREISFLIKKIKEKYNITSLIVTHDMMCTKITADRLLFLKDGVFTFEGRYEEAEKSDDDFVKSFFTFTQDGK